ncbi:alkyl hydroperoxide reductase AhpD [Betaproteobacteria bacterium]|nr:alkyl hydroperoxide reductase AhpD [Betaproteobacteria bacterium]
MPQSKKYQNVTKELGGKLKALRIALPDVATQFNALHQTAVAPGVLDAKTKELIALAVSVAARCEGCVGFHALALAKLGATEAEVAETLGVAVLMGGGPSMMYSAEALAAFKEFNAA